MSENVENFLREKVRRLLELQQAAEFGSPEYEKARAELQDLVVMSDLKALDYIEEMDPHLH